jgi:hypothetical protein
MKVVEAHAKRGGTRAVSRLARTSATSSRRAQKVVDRRRAAAARW